MKSKSLLLSLVAVAALAVPAVAGDGHKCTAGTQECLDQMAAHMKSRGWVGLELEPDEATGRMSVLRVVTDSPAQAAGFQEGDVLLALNGVEMSEGNKEKLYAVQKQMAPGKSVTYTVKRMGSKRDISVTLASMPEEVIARYVGAHMLEHAAVDVAQN
jgi:C-terminal processing protease CtpA/Prc